MPKLLLNIIGTIALVLGIIGIFLPLLPTTPFLLLASACYVRGSRRMHAWLMNHRHLGPYLHAIYTDKGLSRRKKAVALSTMWASLAVSAWIMPIPWVRPLLLIPGIGVTIYLLRMKTAEPEGSTQRLGHH
ncbi:DUF454 domain-containing protein [Allopusillimonas soli]|uniref:YbaN family protein n=1 Tax=Allopusillimonas soli TaxID=659016 RepID=A0A853F796_9BURK|nr:YbaN family protein [Allopusillimonas soli]NYT35412.1 YbaN family protein [Allopusillimonas soli]TEA75827.1 DUF454 domain-containing protein [Allopusillimonas soli]